MTAKFRKWPAAMLGMALCLSLTAGMATGYAQDKKDEKKVKVNKKEEEAYKKVLAAQGADPNAEIAAGEDFLTKFPDSRYAGGIYGMLTSAYYATGNTQKMFETGDKALTADPNNADVLALLAMAIPRRTKMGTPDAQQQLQKAQQYAQKAIEVIPTMTKPETIDDATFEKAKNDKLALAHSGLGLIDIDNKKFDEARTELQQAVQLASNPDPVDYYLLGDANAQASYLHAAIDAYGKCSVTGPLVAQCKGREDAVKKQLASGTVLSRD